MFLSALLLSRAAAPCWMRALSMLLMNRRRSDGGKQQVLGVPRRRHGTSDGLRPSPTLSVLRLGLTSLRRLSARARKGHRPSRIALMKGAFVAVGGMVEGAGVAETPLTGTGVQVVRCHLVLRRSRG